MKTAVSTTKHILNILDDELGVKNVMDMINHPDLEEAKKIAAQETGYAVDTINVRLQVFKSLIENKVIYPSIEDSARKYIQAALEDNRISVDQTLALLSTLSKDKVE